MQHEKPFADAQTSDRINKVDERFRTLRADFEAKLADLLSPKLSELLRHVERLRGHFACLAFFFDKVQRGDTMPVTGESFSIGDDRLTFIQMHVTEMRKLIVEHPELEMYIPLMKEPHKLLELLDEIRGKVQTAQSA